MEVHLVGGGRGSDYLHEAMVLTVLHDNTTKLLDAVAALAEVSKTLSSEAKRKEIGQFFTSQRVARFLARLPELRATKPCLRVLDPGAGAGMLGIAMAERVLSESRASVHLVAVEPDPTAAEVLGRSLALASRNLGKRLTWEIRPNDFLAFDPDSLGRPILEPFDIVIANPPYFKVSPSESRGGDAPNMYARFMEVAARLLVLGGQLACIIPRSFTSGAYFERFRKRFHASMCLERAHVFDSRRDAFRADGVQQENVITLYRRDPSRGEKVIVSSTEGEADLESPTVFPVERDLVLPGDTHASVFLPVSAEDVRAIRLFRTWKHNLGSYGLEVSTGPVVPFRNSEFLRGTADAGETLPMLWMQHVRSEGIAWPLGAGFRKTEHIDRRAGSKLLVRNSTYVLMRRFTAKEERRRFVAAVLRKGALPGAHLGLENHLNFIHQPGGEMAESQAVAVATLLNSALFDSYYRIASGHTQVNATELRVLPLPSPEFLTTLGQRSLDGSAVGGSLVEQLLDP